MEGTPISPVQATVPELNIEAAPVNTAPVELDGTPTTPETAREKATEKATGSRRGSASEDDQQVS